MSERMQWNGRDVELIEFDIDVGEELMELAKLATTEAEQKNVLYFQLVHSARYADDHSPVFASVADVRAQPFRLYSRLQRMALAASDLNRLEVVDADAGTFPDTATDAVASARLSNGEARQ